MASQDQSQRTSLVEIALLFLKLGAISVGGPAAHIALMENEFVRRRGWLSSGEFLDLLGATNLIPGPNSTEMAIHIGHRRAGLPGLLIAGISFILPAMLIVMGCGWAYQHYGKLPQLGAALYGAKPVIIAIVVQALWSLGKTAVKTPFLGFVTALTAALGFMGVNELILLFGAGALLAIVRMARRRRVEIPAFGLPMPPAAFAIAATTSAGVAAAPLPFGVWPLFWFFLKIGSVLYGSGYVLLAFLQNGLVERYGWLTETQLLDAIAIGQITPGPVFTTATFIGYLLGGAPAALIATVAIFLPAFLFVAISGPVVKGIRRSPAAASFLDGVNAASLALMAVVTAQIGRAAMVDWAAVTLAVAAGVGLFRYKLNAAWLVLGGVMAGVIKAFIL